MTPNHPSLRTSVMLVPIKSTKRKQVLSHRLPSKDPLISKRSCESPSKNQSSICPKHKSRHTKAHPNKAQPLWCLFYWFTTWYRRQASYKYKTMRISTWFYWILYSIHAYKTKNDYFIHDWKYYNEYSQQFFLTFGEKLEKNIPWIVTLFYIFRALHIGTLKSQKCTLH